MAHLAEKQFLEGWTNMIQRRVVAVAVV